MAWEGILGDFWRFFASGWGLLVTRTFSNHLFVIALRVFQLQRDDNLGFDMPRVWLLFRFVLVWWDGEEVWGTGDQGFSCSGDEI